MQSENPPKHACFQSMNRQSILDNVTWSKDRENQEYAIITLRCICGQQRFIYSSDDIPEKSMPCDCHENYFFIEYLNE